MEKRSTKPITKLMLQSLMTRVAENPGDARLQLELSQELRHAIPRWHLPMLYDTGRNEFYRRAIFANVKGKTVLDIGTGTGFLALMAAEAGAKHVYACEMNPLFQIMAEENFAKSAHSVKITLIQKESDRIKIGNEIPEQVDIVLSEILSSDVFSENMIPYLRDARRLLKPDGIFLPSRIEAWACLVDTSHNVQHDDTNPLTEPLEKLVNSLPQFNERSLKLVSDCVRIVNLEDGAELDEPAPWDLTFHRTQESHHSSLCVYFKLEQGRDELTSLHRQPGDSERLLYANSWGQMLFPLESSGEETETLRLHLIDERYIIVTQNGDSQSTKSKTRSPKRVGPNVQVTSAR